MGEGTAASVQGGVVASLARGTPFPRGDEHLGWSSRGGGQGAAPMGIETGAPQGAAPPTLSLPPCPNSHSRLSEVTGLRQARVSGCGGVRQGRLLSLGVKGGSLQPRGSDLTSRDLFSLCKMELMGSVASTSHRT